MVNKNSKSQKKFMSKEWHVKEKNMSACNFVSKRSFWKRKLKKKLGKQKESKKKKKVKKFSFKYKNLYIIFP